MPSVLLAHRINSSNNNNNPLHLRRASLAQHLHLTMPLGVAIRSVLLVPRVNKTNNSPLLRRLALLLL